MSSLISQPQTTELLPRFTTAAPTEPARLERAHISPPTDGDTEFRDNLSSNNSDETIPMDDNTSPTPTGLPLERAQDIYYEVYAKVVEPQLEEVKKSKPWADTTYGEMRPRFFESIIRMVSLSPHKLFVDLGSGVGNVAIYAALRTGCTAFGIEKVTVRAQAAKEQLDRVQRLASLEEGVMGAVELVHGDILDHHRVSQLIGQADLVLVNNLAFGVECRSSYFFSRFIVDVINGNTTVNLRIGQLLRQLKAGAYVFTLKPLGVSARPGKASVRDEDALGHIMNCSSHRYDPDSFSWSPSRGGYYVHIMQGERKQSEV